VLSSVQIASVNLVLSRLTLSAPQAEGDPACVHRSRVLISQNHLSSRDKPILTKEVQSSSRIRVWQKSHSSPWTGFELRSVYSPLRSGQNRQFLQQCHILLRIDLRWIIAGPDYNHARPPHRSVTPQQQSNGCTLVWVPTPLAQPPRRSSTKR
jgi:hypothetical protein